MNQKQDSKGFVSTIQSAVGRVISLAKEYGPGFISRAIDAYSNGAKALETTALSASGVDAKSGIIAGILTLVLFSMTNLYLTWSVRTHYFNYKPEFLQSVSTIGDAKRELRLAGWVPKDLDASNQAIQKIQDRDFSSALYRWIEIEYLSSGMDKENEELGYNMQRLVLGNPRGWILVSSDVASGSDVFAQLYQQKPAIMSILDGQPVRKATFMAMLDDLTRAVQQRVRLQKRINGMIQLVTVFVGLFTLTALVRRYLLITKLANQWLGSNLGRTMEATTDDPQTAELKEIVNRLKSTSDADADALIRDEVGRLSRDTTDEIYDGYWFLAGIMPSLGFIGTVIGMSSSLMLADGLFVGGDRQLAIAQMTSELGLAFDTTLVALVLGIITSIPLAAMRSRERTFFREFAGSIADYRNLTLGS